MSLVCKVPILDVVIHSTKLVLNILIRYFCALWKRTWLCWLDLAWMYCRPTALWLRARHHLCNLELRLISTCINLNFWVVYYEVVYIIVRYDVRDDFLILFAIWTLPLILISFYLCHLLGSFCCNRPLIDNLCAFIWVLFKTFTYTSIIVWWRRLVIEVKNFSFWRFSNFLGAWYFSALIHLC